MKPVSLPLVKLLPIVITCHAMLLTLVYGQGHPIHINALIQEGMGEEGTFKADDKRSSTPGGPPVISSTKKTLKYKHYSVGLTNRSKVAGENLRVEYIIYTISGDGKLISNSASKAIKVIEPGKRFSMKTRGATLIRSTTKTGTIDVDRRNRVRTGSKTSRSRERFGGIWIRVYAGEKIVGEKRQLEQEVEKIKPAWKSPGKDGRPTITEGITLPEIQIKPPAPKKDSERPNLPPKPPIPKPPSR